MDAFAGTLLLAAMGALGVALAHRAWPFLTSLEQIAYGIPLGMVVASLILVMLASVAGLTTWLVIATVIICAIAAAAVWPLRALPRRLSFPGRPSLERASGRWLVTALIPTLVIAAFALRWLLLWAGALTYDREGLWAGHINIWGDWPVHLGLVTSFAYGDNFPPSHPRFAGHPIGYHFLIDLTAAAMVKLGTDPSVALALQSFVLSVVVAIGLYALARRLGLSPGGASLALTLFLLGGGLAWIVPLSEAFGARDPLAAFLQLPWDGARQGQLNFRWQNIYLGFLEPQRGYLYGLPLAALVLTSLLVGATAKLRRAFVLAGVVAGLLPFAHLPTLLALALVTPVLFILFPSRGWILFFATWAGVAAPQLLFQEGGAAAGAASAFRVQPGWIAGADPWLWFWVKNLGVFLPLLAGALLERGMLASPGARALRAFMVIFAVLNLVVFQPWDWDNHKGLVYWYLAGCFFVAAFLVATWQQSRAPAMRAVVVGVVAALLLSGTLENVHQMLGRDRYMILSAEEIELARRVREATAPRALFVTGLQNAHPVSTMAGRRVVMGYPGWLWTEGIDYAQRERDVRAIYAFAPNAPQLLSTYGVDYVVIGPVEREQLKANVDAFRRQYTRVLGTEHYDVFDVRTVDTGIGPSAPGGIGPP